MTDHLLQTHNPFSRGILTIGFGNEKYILMAKALGRSLRRSCPGMATAIVTDRTDSTFAGLFDHVIPIQPHRGPDVAQKLFLDLYSPFQSTLFVDCDSLVFRSLDFVFRELAGGPTIIPDPLYFHSREKPKPGIDFDRLEKKTALKEVPGFNGGIYYIEKDTPSQQIFIRAREILGNHEDYGIGTFRSSANDENILALSMALSGFSQETLSSLVMRETFGLDGPLDIDVLRGKASLTCYGITWTPAVVHFCSGWHDCGAYQREMRILSMLASENRGVRWFAPVYSTWLHVCLRIRALRKSVWNSVPRPIRLRYHAILTRVRRIKNARNV